VMSMTALFIINTCQTGRQYLHCRHADRLNAIFSLWATVCKTVHPMLSDSCLSCSVCPVCDVGVLWPNGWMDHGETWQLLTFRPMSVVCVYVVFWTDYSDAG